MLKSSKLTATVLVAGIFASGVSFASEIISAENPEAIYNVAKGFGSAELKKDSTGDPMIVGRINGTKYGILFYGCKHHKKCDDIIFHAGWSGTDVTMRQVNKWNQTKKYGKAYLDKDGDPVLEMSVNLDYGVTKDNFEDTFDWWSKALKGFKEKVLHADD